MKCPSCGHRLRTGIVVWWLAGKFCVHCGFWTTTQDTIPKLSKVSIIKKILNTFRRTT